MKGKFHFTISQKTLAVVKAIETISKKKRGSNFAQTLVVYFGLIGRDSVYDFLNYAIYFSDIIEKIDSDLFLECLVPEVVKEAGYPELIPEDTPVKQLEGWKVNVYDGSVPPLIKKLYLENPQKWSGAFAKVNKAKGSGFLPYFCDFIRNESYERSQGSVRSFERENEIERTHEANLSCALLNMNPSEEQWSFYLGKVDLFAPELKKEVNKWMKRNLSYQVKGIHPAGKYFLVDVFED